MTLGEIAFADPKLAYTLMNAGKVSLGGYVDTGGWEIINVGATFGVPANPGLINSLAENPPQETVPADTIVKGQLFGTVEADLWIRKVTYTVRRPLAYTGNIFKSQSDYFNALNPNINFQMTINSYSRYVISDDFMPLENIGMAFEASSPAGIVMRFSSSVQLEMINTRPFYGMPPSPACAPYCTTTAANATQPAVGSTTTVTVANCDNLNVGQTVYIENAGTYTVLSITPGALCSLFLQLDALSASAMPVAPGGVIPAESCLFWTVCTGPTTPRVGENPTQVIVSLHGTRLPSEVYGSCDTDKAVDFLRKKGVLPEKP